MLTSVIQLESPTKHAIEELPAFDRSIDLIRLIGEIYDPHKFFDHAAAEFRQALFINDIRPHIKKLMEAGDLNKKAIWDKHVDSFHVVKRARKLAEAFGCIITFVDDGHVQPKLLKQLNKEIGDFKDEVVYRPTKKNSDDLYKALDRILENGLPLLNPASMSSFWEKYKSLLDDVCKLFNSEDLNLKQHHKLRVRMRSFVYFYKTIAASTNSDELFNFAQYLNIVVAEMGKTQDKIYVLKHSGKIDEERDRTHLNATHRKVIGDFLRMHGI